MKDKSPDKETPPKGRGRIFDSITDTIGDTPLVRLDRLSAMYDVKANLLAKLEFFNPIGSVKDRIGVSMVDALEASGRVQPGIAENAARRGIDPKSGVTDAGDLHELPLPSVPSGGRIEDELSGCARH